ncbi:MAG: hypothetical protein A2020_04210 [Lentisphaerae bacterium GWF2_45_14]|nr:MAG: hypothetical protein A2020_04210 [Lentisphaerae bacterium GWF2_45_14]
MFKSGLLMLFGGIFCSMNCLGMEIKGISRAENPEKWETEVNISNPVSEAFVTTNLEPSTIRKISTDKTEARLILLPDALGVYFRCYESKELPAVGKPRILDSLDPAKEDAVEIFIDINNDGERAFGVAVNKEGTIMDAVYFVQDYVDKRWDSGAEAHCSSGKGYWDAFVKIPFKEMGITPDSGDIAGIAFMRTRHVDGKKISSAWPSPKTVYTWWQRREVPEPFFYADMLLGYEPTPGLKLFSLSRGLYEESAVAEENAFTGQILNMSSDTIPFSLTASSVLPGKEEVVVKKLEGVLVPGEIFPFRMEYPAGKGSVVFRLTDGKSGKTIYTSSLTKSFEMPKRIADDPGSFDKNLITVKNNAPARDGFVMFGHHMKGKEGYVQYAESLGLGYDISDVIENIGKNKEIVYMNLRHDTRYNDLRTHAKAFREVGAKTLYSPYAKNIAAKKYKTYAECPYMVNVSSNPKTNDSWSFQCLPTEEFKKDYFQSLEDGLRDYRDIIWGVFVADEFDYTFSKAARVAFASPESQAKYPEVMKINEDVKKRFGHGIPNEQTPKEELPYCKIAWQRWLNDWVAKFTDEVGKKVKLTSPDVYFVGDDPQGQVFPYDYGLRWKNVDVAMHQTADKAMPYDIGTSVITKFVKDSIGDKEFWPCVHYEASLAIYNLDEMRELLSRAFRNGATGMSLFNLSWSGRLGRTEDVGAPERWAYLLQLSKMYASGVRAKLPEKVETGAFYSSYSSMADYSKGIGAVYNYLGPATGAYFKFIYDCALERGDTSLDGFKTVFVHDAEYESDAALEKLLKAVHDNGMTLVIADPLAFSKAPEGGALKNRDALLNGIRVGDKAVSENVVPGKDASPLLQSIKQIDVNKAYVILSVPEGAKELLRYKSGGPALLEWPCGKGKVVYFAFNPFHFVSTMSLDPNAPTGFDFGDKAIPDPLLVPFSPSTCKFFKVFLSHLGIAQDEKIWSLKLPAPEQQLKWPKSVCLTGNSIVWSLSLPKTCMNPMVPGAYRYSVAPANPVKAGSDGWISFAEGRLTDRIAAQKFFKKLNDCVDTWKDKSAFSLEIDLGADAFTERIDLYVTGEYPGIRCGASPDGKNWSELAKSDEKGKTDMVRKISIPLNSMKTRYLKLDFDKRTSGPMTIAEMDIWGYFISGAPQK